jgi:hypothetical protein
MQASVTGRGRMRLMRRALLFPLGALGLAALCVSAAAQTRQAPAARQAPAGAHGDPQGWRFKLHRVGMLPGAAPPSRSSVLRATR